MIKLTKQQEKQYKMLNSKFKISKREYVNFYNDIRKARRKTTRLQKEGGTIKTPKYATGLRYLKSREDFLKVRKNVKRLLSRDYKKKSNAQQRKQLKDNIYAYFSKEDAKKIWDEFEKMTDDELIEFFNNNDDIDRIMYDSKTDLLDIIGETANKMLTRTQNFNKYGF